MWCNNSNETSSAGLLHGSIYYSAFNKQNFEFCQFFFCPLRKRVNNNDNNNSNNDNANDSN